MLKKEKVFCKKCRYFIKRKEDYLGLNNYGSKIIKVVKEKDTPEEEGKEYPIHCVYNIDNKKNNCEHYEENKGWLW
jgi:hypothetical protein